jgi:hypothetical protein
MVVEPSPVEALAILEGLQERYERHHRVVYSSDALEAAVALSSRYIADRHLPDKAIDLLDEAGSRVRIAAYQARRAGAGRDSAEAAASSYMELEQVVATKAEAVADALFEEAALLRQRELELKARLSGAPEVAPVVPVVMAEHIEAVVSAWTGVPVERLSQDDRDRLLTLADVLQVSGRSKGATTWAACGVERLRRAAPTFLVPSFICGQSVGGCAGLLSFVLGSLTELIRGALTQRPLAVARDWPGRRLRGHRPRHHARLLGPQEPRQAHCHPHVLGAHGRGQDRAYQGAAAELVGGLVCPPNRTLLAGRCAHPLSGSTRAVAEASALHQFAQLLACRASPACSALPTTTLAARAPWCGLT